MPPLELVVAIADREVPVVADVTPDTSLGELGAALATAAGGGTASLVLDTGRADPAVTVGQSGLRAGDLVGLGVRVPARERPLVPVELAVVGGLDGGRRVDAPSGAVLRVGREPSSGLVLRDPEVSRRHAELAVGSGGPSTLRDCGSRNGTGLRGGRVVDDVEVTYGEPWRVGETVLALRRLDPTGVRLAAAGTGRLRFNRPPRLVPPTTPRELTLPAKPAEPKPRRFPLAGVLVPLLAAVVMLVIWPGSKLYLVFLVLSPVMLIGSAVSDRRGGRRDHREATREYADRLAAVQRRCTELLADEALAARDALPDPTALLTTATLPGRRLWERRPTDPDFLRLRLGLGTLPARTTLRQERGTSAAAYDDPPPSLTLADVPVAVDLATDRVLGLAGPRGTALAVARAVVAHAATLHAPADLGVVVLTGRAEAGEWEWASWLPHTTAPATSAAARLLATDAEQATARLAELQAVVEARREARHSDLSAAVSGRRYLVVLDGARRLRDLPRLAELLQDGPPHGVHFLCLDDDEAALPAECGATAVLQPGAGTRLSVRRGGLAPLSDVLADGLDLATAARLARALAPVQLLGRGEDGSELPAVVRLRDLLPATDPDGVLAGWRGAGRSTTALLGVGAEGPVTVDLRRDGPHALVAGTSGAGKSELLQTLITSLALGNRPDALSFVLVDYKGGSAFKDAARLPHCAGLVTDLDEHLVGRALDSLTAELKRRETVLAGAGAKDLEALWHQEQQDRPGEPTALPRLVIVIDEFASLVEEVPDFVRGVVGIGMRGRSLGVHVVLATQRPAGVVTGEIRANVNLRICLRVTSSTDSTDVIDVPDAARIARGTPGRALVRTGHGELTTVQVARAGWPSDGETDQDVRRPARAQRRDVTALGAPVARQAVTDDGEAARTDLTDVVAAVREAADRLGSGAAVSPWLPPLPELLTVDEVAVPGGAALGRIDRPRRQVQEPFTLDLAATGSLLVAGAVRSGRSTAARTLLTQLAAAASPADLHLYVLDCGNRALAALADLPHSGAVVDGDDTGRVERLMALLADEVECRQRLLVGHASVAEARAAGVPLADVVVALDRLESFVARYVEHDAGRLVERLEQLLRQGPAVGLTFVLTSDRTGFTSRIASAVAARLVLRQADRDDVAVFGLTPRDVPRHLPPGRGVWAATGEQVQVALLDADPSGAAQAAAVRRVALAAARHDAPEDRLPRRADPLPDRITLADLEALGPVPCATAQVTVGAGGERLGPVVVDLAADGPCFVVAGPARSGRSSALVAIAQGLLDRPDPLPVVVVAPRPSALRELPGVAEVLTSGPDLAAELSELVEAYDGRLALVVDDAELLADGREASVLEEVARTARDRGTVLVAGATTDELLLTRYRGWLATARRCRAGLLLAPAGPTDGEVFDLRLARGVAAGWPVGRAMLVRRGAATPVQVPLPDAVAVPGQVPVPA